MPAWMYILRLKSGNLYVGATANLHRRCVEHFSGKACRTTTLDPPEKLTYSESFIDLSEARQREQQIKRWTREKKEAPIKGNIDQLRKLAKSRN